MNDFFAPGKLSGGMVEVEQRPVVGLRFGRLPLGLRPRGLCDTLGAELLSLPPEAIKHSGADRRCRSDSL